MNEKTGFSLNGYLMALILAVVIPISALNLNPIWSASVLVSLIILALALGCLAGFFMV